MDAKDDIGRLIALAQKEAASLSGHLTALQDALKCPEKDDGRAISLTGKRRVTRGKIEADEELEAFIRARIVTQTFPEVAAAVAAHFAPARRVTMSKIHRWWHRTGKHSDRRQSANPGYP